MSTPLRFAEETARKAGDLLLEHFHLMGTRANLKSDRTVVTEADLAVDKFIAEAIKAAFPEDDILSEEGTTLLEKLDRPIWIIDPLDGTTNFSLGLPIWGVSISRLVNGEPDSAALFYPLLNELYTTQRSQGAFLNGNPIQVKPYEKGQPAAFFTCCSRTFRRYHVKIPYKARILGSATYDMCTVARGAAIMGFLSNPKIWDIAGGWLVVHEAGGIVETLEAPNPFPLITGTDYNEMSYPLLMAADISLARQVREGIVKK
ncbi:MAG: hypothetical protein E3J88_05740 [Anaerolineales bacterium]|nr:MAG: hypothetical protein E3J88_05740 [Anaerolineales bacterium]